MTLLIAISCDSNPCEKVNCVEGFCDVGLCICDQGFEGDDCSIKSVVKFIGEWHAIDDCASEIHQYKATISASSGALQMVTISNFGGLGTNTLVSANVEGSVIIINTQNVGNSCSVSGFGNISATGDQIQFTYTVTDLLGNSVKCSSSWVS